MSAPDPRPAPRREPLVFLHVGDLHLQDEAAQNAHDLNAIFDQIAAIAPRDLFDFVYLPGDLAENGYASEYRILKAALDRHPDLPVRLIPGDHDRQHGRMDDFQAFAASLGDRLPEPVVWDLEQPPSGCPETWPVEPVPHYCASTDIRGVRCLFIDMVSPGFGRKGIGLDFRLGRPQTQWLSDQLAEAGTQNMPCAVFMHAYPDDLREPDERLDIGGLFWATRVRLVEMGHTHYNELGHDGRTTYAAARSVGQNEDGSVGYAVGAINEGEVSWRFRALDRNAPFVLITCPADRRLATRALQAADDGRVIVRAVVLSDSAEIRCRCRVDDGPWQTMTRASEEGAFEAAVEWPYGSRRITVEAIHPSWPGYGPDHIDRDVIEPPPTVLLSRSRPEGLGSDACNLGAWLEKGVRGDQLGPNRAGRDW